MKTGFGFTIGCVLLAGLFTAGCNQESTEPDQDQPPVGVSNENQSMVYLAGEDEFVKNMEQTFEDKSMEPFEYGTFGKIQAEITPLRFGRFVTNVTKSVDIQVQPGDSIAIAFVEKTITGTFKIKGLNGSGDTVIVEKPFVDKATHNVIFKRIARDQRRYWRNWVPVATSLTEGGTETQSGTPDIALTQVQLFIPNGDTITVTDPNTTYLRYWWTRLFDGGHANVPGLIGGSRVLLQATVVSASADTDLVALRFGVGTFHNRRMRMHLISEVNNGDGTFTRVFEAPFFVHLHRGWFHAGVDAMTKGTLYDDVAPYSVSWWGVPYRVF